LAVTKYDEFISTYPTHKLAPVARVERDLTNIDRKLAAPGNTYADGLDAIDQFIERHRSDEDYRDWFPLLARYATRIAVSCYQLASRQHNPELIQLGDRSRDLFKRFEASDGSDESQNREITSARRQAQADLLEYSVSQQAQADCDAALKAKRIDQALAVIRQAIDRYPHFADQEAFQSRIQQALQAEKAMVKTLEMTPERITELVVEQKPSTRFSSTQLIELERLRPGIPESGEFIWLLSENQLIAFDRMTGQFGWAIATGSRRAFEPIPITLTHASWIIPLANGTGLGIAQQKDGQLAWSLQLTSPIISEPSVIGNLIMLVTDDHKLLAIEAMSGKLVAAVEFPQTITAPITPLDSRTLCAVARQDVIYLIDRQNWSCEEVRYLGQSPNSIQSRPVVIEDELLIVQNDQVRSGKIVVGTLVEKELDFSIRQTERLPGIALGHPLIWGDRLFLEMNGPRIATWQLSNRPEDPLLTRITNANIPFSGDIRLFVQPIEGDRLLVAGENLRELTLLTSSFEQLKKSIELGRASQSLQIKSTDVYVAGSRSHEKGTDLYHYNHSESDSYWRLTAGTDVLDVRLTDQQTGKLRVIDRAGNLYHSSLMSPGSLTSSESFFPAAQRQREAGLVSLVQLPAGDTSILVLGQELRSINAQGQRTGGGQLSETSLISPVLAGNLLAWVGPSGVHLSEPKDGSEPVQLWQFPSAADGENRIQIQQLLAISETELLCLDRHQKIISLFVHADPEPHLAVGNEFEFDSPAIGSLIKTEKGVVAVTQDHSLLVIDPTTLSLQQTVMLPQAVKAGPFLLDKQLILQMEDGQISAFQTDQLDQPVWQLPQQTGQLEHCLRDEISQRILLGSDDGSLSLVNPDNGKLMQRVSLPAPISCSPVNTASSIVLGTEAGTLIVIDRIQLTGNSGQE
ncbi:MAG: PQQ-binding-like beta-propeller repeat protein, partial [Planctomycetaceae bacterium]|nr:PQQ-binding-like beta-propeller repeat protein [Planctomycetaceae bacterium]